MREPVWIEHSTVLLLHRRQLAEHGGGEGVRDEGMLESALHRPRNKWAYEGADIVDLAAAYAFGIARNHPFVDGNKRTAWVVCRVFLDVNGLAFSASDEDKYTAMLALAAGDLSEEDFANWLRKSCKPRASGS